MWAGARVIGILDVEFWELTPRSLDAYQRAYMQRERRMDMRFGALMALYAGAHLKPGHEVPDWTDFFPDPLNKQSAVECDSRGILGMFRVLAAQQAKAE